MVLASRAAQLHLRLELVATVEFHICGLMPAIHRVLHMRSYRIVGGLAIHSIVVLGLVAAGVESERLLLNQTVLILV